MTEPKPEPFPELPGPAYTSARAVTSVFVGIFLFLGCLSGMPAIFLGRQALKDIAASKGRLRGGGFARAGITLGWIGCFATLVMLIMPATRSAREAARRSQCSNNLKQIGLAFHNYHSSQGSLPAAAITDKDGRPLLSWRVAILPYLEQAELYAKFHLDEPWHSPHNLTLLDQRPMTYACPSEKDLPRGMTGYQAIIGPHTAFTPDFQPTRFADFTDGMSSTLLVVESRHSVPWTKPDDIPFDIALHATGIGGPHGNHVNGLNALFADGSLRFLKGSVSPTVLRGLLTRDGNEAITSDMF